MNFTRKVLKDGKPTAGIGLWINLTEDQVAVVQGLADPEGISCKEYLNRVAAQAIDTKIAANKLN